MSYFVFYKVNVHLNDTFVFVIAVTWSVMLTAVSRNLCPAAKYLGLEDEIEVRLRTLMREYLTEFCPFLSTLSYFPAVWKMKLLSLDLANVICTGSTFRVFVISRYNETPVILNHNNFITNCQSIRRNVDLARFSTNEDLDVTYSWSSVVPK